MEWDSDKDNYRTENSSVKDDITGNKNNNKKRKKV